jgi:hypothetical protein
VNGESAPEGALTTVRQEDNSRPRTLEPDVYGEPTLYVCRCHYAHGVLHVCGLCRSVRDGRGTADPWVPAERCYVCLHDEEARLRAALAVVEAKLRHAVHARDPITDQVIPPRFLTPQGWVDE